MTDRTFLDSGRHDAMSKAVDSHIMTGSGKVSSALPSRKGAEQDKEDHAGFNYTPASQAGHTVK